ncbi:STAS-like domain-containing protein [Phenylobacterium terrae]|uniref:STAS-like domain-containing protein n=1 Tax=Phenylobacterium terrae TaxID=2665495 RepID=A0ABW4N5L9_9CAUL
MRPIEDIASFRIDLAADFSPTPLGRYKRQGRFSGEAFREDHLKPALNRYRRITIDLDGATGLSTGFLDEAFAGLVRDGTLSETGFWDRIELIATRDPGVLSEVRTFVSRAALNHASH